MVNVSEAENIILSQAGNYGIEMIPFELSLGRVLAEPITTDRDLPPYNRVTMDGIAIRYEDFDHGIRSFHIKATQAAGDDPVNISEAGECIEIMTGAALPITTDTVIRYEDLDIKQGKAVFTGEGIAMGQYIHVKGKDKKQNEVVAKANQLITPAMVHMAASVGKITLAVKKLPKVVIISTGDELVEVNQQPSPYQVRRSNNYTIHAVLEQYLIKADMIHLPDDPGITKNELESCLGKYDVIILSGGISMGKFDYVPDALEQLSVKKLFHKVKQRPGKPFWFGMHSNRVVVFAFPGNPVSTFMCLHRYFIPWLEASFAIEAVPKYAILDKDFHFTPSLQYFLQVHLQLNHRGHLLATALEGNGSGDFVNLMNTDAFLELPMEQTHFKKGEVYRAWPFVR